jgi:hypothetical protein
METAKLRALQRPSETDSLLDSFVWNRPANPKGLRKVVNLTELSAALQKIARNAKQQNRAWGAWTDERNDWLYTAEMSLAMSRERGHPVLEVASFNEDGHLEESEVWMRTGDGRWQQCFT